MTVPIKLSCSFHEKKEKTKQVNDFNASRTGKFLSMAEVEQTQAIAQGQAEGAEMGYLMQHNGGKQGYINTMALKGANNALATQTAATTAQLQSMGDAEAVGIDAARSNHAAQVHNVQMGITDGSGNVNEKKLNKVSAVDATKKTSDTLTNKKVQDKHGGQNRGSAETTSSGAATNQNVAIDSANTVGYDTLYHNAVDSAHLSRAQFDQMIKDFGGVEKYGQLSQEQQDNAAFIYSRTKDQLKKMGYNNPREAIIDSGTFDSSVKTALTQKKISGTKDYISEKTGKPKKDISNAEAATSVASAGAAKEVETTIDTTQNSQAANKADLTSKENNAKTTLNNSEQIAEKELSGKNKEYDELTRREQELEKKLAKPNEKIEDDGRWVKFAGEEAEKSMILRQAAEGKLTPEQAAEKLVDAGIVDQFGFGNREEELATAKEIVLESNKTFKQKEELSAIRGKKSEMVREKASELRAEAHKTLDSIQEQKREVQKGMHSAIASIPGVVRQGTSKYKVNEMVIRNASGDNVVASNVIYDKNGDLVSADFRIGSRSSVHWTSRGKELSEAEITSRYVDYANDGAKAIATAAVVLGNSKRAAKAIKDGGAYVIDKFSRKPTYGSNNINSLPTNYRPTN